MIAPVAIAGRASWFAKRSTSGPPSLGAWSLKRSSVLLPLGSVAPQSSSPSFTSLATGCAAISFSTAKTAGLGRLALVHSTSHGSPEKKTLFSVSASLTLSTGAFERAASAPRA